MISRAARPAIFSTTTSAIEVLPWVVTSTVSVVSRALPVEVGPCAGVEVEVGARQTAVDLDIVVEYGVEIGELTKAIRRNVISAIERMTTLEVTEVNIVVHDVHVPNQDADEPVDSRVE